MKINLSKFNELVEQKFISVQKHPTDDLLVWSYTHKAQFSKEWTPETTIARGLITDLEGNIKARPFKKFFNYGEHTGEDSKLPALPIEEFEVFDKLDGSLGILYFDSKGQPNISTRGSFVSDQAIKANEILRKKYKDVPFDKDKTYLFEIIYPQNRIVVNYGEVEDLFLIACYYINKDEELSYDELEAFAKTWKIPTVKRFSFDSVDEITKVMRDNAEGFVIRYKSGVRMKMKYEEYVRLHRLVTGVNSKSIWDLLRHSESFDELMDRVPDEFIDWVEKTKEGLEKAFAILEMTAIKDWEKVKDLPTRKEQAKKMFKKYKKSEIKEVWKDISPAGGIERTK